MSTTHRTRLSAALLIGVPLLSNAASFVVFTPLFVPGRTPADADVRLASIRAAIVILLLELLALLLIVRALRRERASLKGVVNVRRDRVRAYLSAGGIALLPKLVAGWLSVRAQAQAGVEASLSRLSWVETWMVVRSGPCCSSISGRDHLARVRPSSTSRDVAWSVAHQPVLCAFSRPVQPACGCCNVYPGIGVGADLSAHRQHSAWYGAALPESVPGAHSGVWISVGHWFNLSTFNLQHSHLQQVPTPAPPPPPSRGDRG